MARKKDSDNYSVEELEQLLYQKKRAQRHQRLQRLKQEGRVVVVPGVSPPDSSSGENERVATLPEGKTSGRPRWLANKLLLLVEIGAVVGLIVLAVMAWNATRELNQEINQVQEIQSITVAPPLPTATPVIGVVILPSGHKPPVSGRPPEPGEAGDIPAHLLPIIDAYVPPPIPTPGPQQARRIQVPALGVDRPIVQGDDWDQLKKGVGQHLGSGLPGQDGNLVLSAHNDIYGEIFRNLDRLAPGDEIIISTDRQNYTYVVRELQIVDPTEVWVMSPTEYASTTLISCYPYLINNRRIVVFADMAIEGPLSGPSS
jgi:sortase A